MESKVGHLHTSGCGSVCSLSQTHQHPTRISGHLWWKKLSSPSCILFIYYFYWTLNKCINLFLVLMQSPEKWSPPWKQLWKQTGVPLWKKYKWDEWDFMRSRLLPSSLTSLKSLLLARPSFIIKTTAMIPKRNIRKLSIKHPTAMTFVKSISFIVTD